MKRTLFFAVIMFQNFWRRGKPQECDLNTTCASGHIAREICERRLCCYTVRNDTMTNCFQKKNPQYIQTPKMRKPPDNERFPEDNVQLPKDLKDGMESLDNLTVTGAIQTINKFEKYLEDKARNNSELDWRFEIPKAFRTFVMVSPESIYKPITFASGTSIQLLQHWGTTENGTVADIYTVIFAEYPALTKAFKKEQDHRRNHCFQNVEYLDGAPVISINAFDENWNKLSVQVTYHVEGVNTSKFAASHDQKRSLSCTYLREMKQDWSTGGCQVLSMNESTMTCTCNHTTKFSMLFVLNDLNVEISDDQLNSINTLEYIMESLSLVCLVATFGVLTLVQRRRSKGSSISGMRAGERTAVHANFVSALALFHFTRLLSQVAMQEDKACKTIAILSHYFMLSSGMWMVIEGMLLYLNVILRSMKNTALGVHKYWTGWGIPAIIVIISAATGLQKEIYMERADIECTVQDGMGKTPLFGSYEMNHSFCWLGRNQYMLWAALGPLIIIFTVNIFILTHTVIFIWRLNRKTDKMMPSDCSNDGKHFWKTTKSVLVLFPILGVPWLIGFAINIHHTTLNLVFQYTHVVLNGLQGFFIFVLYCVINRESRGIVSRVVSSRWEQHKVSVSASNTLARSTSGGSRRKGQRKSISSQMASEQNATGTPVNITRMGSQYSIYTSSMNRKHSSGSGSTSLSGCAHRINRIISVGSTDIIGTRYKPGHYMKAGSSASLPRLGKIENHKYLTRSGSVSSINIVGKYNRERYQQINATEVPDTYICKACKDMACIHAVGDVAGLDELQSGNQEAVLLGYKQTSSLDSLHLSVPATPVADIYLQNRWPRRMTAEEFKRFSAIPEEKRRSGINSIISVDSNEYLYNRMSALSSLKNEEIEMREIHTTITKADVVTESSYTELAEGNKFPANNDDQSFALNEVDWISIEKGKISLPMSIPEIRITGIEKAIIEEEYDDEDVSIHQEDNAQTDSVEEQLIASKVHLNREQVVTEEIGEAKTEKNCSEKLLNQEWSISDEANDAEVMERLRQEELKLTD